jgi:hypothetical protein
MSDAEAYKTRGETRRTGSSEPDPNRPLQLRPIAHIHSEPAGVPAAEAKETAPGDGKERDDAIGQLAGALRTAKQAHRAYLDELRQGDVEPAEDWSTWYAEYLLGLR